MSDNPALVLRMLWLCEGIALEDVDAPRAEARTLLEDAQARCLL